MKAKNCECCFMPLAEDPAKSGSLSRIPDSKFKLRNQNPKFEFHV